MKNCMITLSMIVLTFTLFFSAQAQEKKALSHDDYDQWKGISNTQISNSGKYVCYEVYPYEGMPVRERRKTVPGTSFYFGGI